MMEVVHRIIGGMKIFFEAHGGRYNRFTSYISRNSNYRKFTYISSAILSLLILATLCPIYLVPDVSEAATHDATPATLTYTSIRNTASVSFNVSSAAGTFATSESNEKASFSLSTNNATGYTLTLRTSGSTTTLSDGTNSIASINDAKTSSNFAVNTWGLLPSKYNGTANTTNYYPASSVGFTIEETNTANSSNGIDNPNTYTIGLGIKADFTVPAGTYTNSTIIAEYVANNITYAIYYYSNTTDTVTGMPVNNPQSPQNPFPGTTSTTVNLASAPSRTGYAFLGWCMGTSSSSNITVGINGAADTCTNSSTSQFTAGQSFGINANNPVTYLYAMWQANTYTVTVSNTNTTSSVASLTIPYGGSATVTVTPDSGYYLSSVSCPSGVSCTGYNTGASYISAQTITVANNTANTSSGTLSFVAEEPKIYMQDLTSTSITTLLPSVGSTAMVYDSRDEQAYTIAKLADNKYWMVSNLNLAGGTKLDSDGSNVPAGYTQSNPYFTLPTSTAISSGTSVPSDQFTDNYTAYVFNTGNNTTTCNSNTPCNSYYSWIAATAGGKDSSGNALNSNGSNAAYSICPKGWRLPTSTTSNASATTSPNWKTGDLYILAKAYGANLESDYADFNSLTRDKFNTNAGPGTTPNFLLTGYYNSGSFYNGGSQGYYWSATSMTSPGSAGAYDLSFSSSTVYAAHAVGIRLGLSVRCVFDNTMQNTTSTSLAAAMPNNGNTTTLIDGRDGQEYSIAKIVNMYWMTKSLNIAGGTTLTSSNTNLTTGFTLPASTTSGFDTYDTDYVYNSNRTSCNSTDSCYSYYSWHTATAHWGTISVTSGSSSVDICPKGWRLPTQADFNTLIGTYNTGNALAANPFRGIYNGYYLSSTFYNNYANDGYYWSSTASTTNSAYLLDFYRTGARVKSLAQMHGMQIRCVAKT